MQLTFTIEGTTDLMTHNPISMFKAAGASVSKTKKEPAPEEVAETACYRLEDGSCGIPVLSIRGALIESAKDYKVPGKRYSLAKLLKGCEVAPMEFVPLMRGEKPTPAMIAVLSALLDGGTLSCYEYSHPYKYRLGVKNKKNQLDYRTISSQTFYGLSSREAIQEKGREGVWNRVYEITDHGRTIADRYTT